MKILYPLAKRFIAGYDFDSAKPNIKKLMDEGYEVSVDYIGENSTTILQCERAYNQYVKIINFYKDAKIDASIKPTQLGLNINPLISYQFTKKIAERALRYGHTIRLDMEDVNVTTLTRNLAISLNKEFGNVGVAIQANLSRSLDDVDRLKDNNVSIRLVKGAYKGDLVDVDASARFSSLALYLKAQGANRPAIATHDEKILKKIDDKYYDYEFLYGVRRDIQRALRDKGYRVRIYVPFGTDWFPYTLRRLKEWKNLAFVVRNIFKG